MTTQQIIIAYVYLLLAWQQIGAVVNNKAKNSTDNTILLQQQQNQTTKNEKNITKDLNLAASEQEADRREAPLTDSYGAPLSIGLDSYVPSGPSFNPNLPIPVYGVPDAQSNNIVYPAPPPDLPPPLPSLPNTYGTPVENIQLNVQTLPLIHDNYGPPPPPPPQLPSKYGPPSLQQSSKFILNQQFISKPPKIYGPPRPQKPIYLSKNPKPYPHKHKPIVSKPVFISHKPNFPISFPNKEYGPPQHIGLQYGPPLPQYGPPQELPHKPAVEYGPPLPIHKPPQHIHGIHKPNLEHIHHHKPTLQYGPPEPVPHGPPHPGVPAPPTPPDIKYDGWQPIPGLVSRPPSDTYGLPEGHPHGIEDLKQNVDFSPPPPPSSSLASHSININSHDVSDSYGAPLNAVTGSGGVATSSVGGHHGYGHGHSQDHGHSQGQGHGHAHGHSQGHGHSHGHQAEISLFNNVGVELLPNGVSDTYSAPPLNSYSSNGPYPPSNSPVKLQNHHLHSSGIGLIPPSGVYGLPPNGKHGTHLIGQQPPLLNALDINPPKHPVKFRESVPAGLIESIGQQTAHKDAHGIIESAPASGPVYIPPPVPELPKNSHSSHSHSHSHSLPPPPSSLYSLPSASSPISFQNIVHGSSTAGLAGDISSFNLNSDSYNLGGQFLTSYTAPLGTVDGSYGLPSGGGSAVGLDFSHPPLTIDLTNSLNTKNHISTSSIGGSGLGISGLGVGGVGSGIIGGGGVGVGPGHDCSLHKTQLPSLSYGVPSANSYTASLSSLTTNLGTPHLTYGPPDLHTAHSQTQTNINAIEDSHGKTYGKSLAESFGEGSELIKSQSIDFNNIPVQGALGSYTLQIQSANGVGDNVVPHAQVLNDGLLQSILQAIEQQQQPSQNNDATILGQHFDQQTQDVESQHSIKSAIIVPPPKNNTSTQQSTTTQKSLTTESDSLELIDDNGIALYFSNRNITNSESLRNGQQYGSYISFKQSKDDRE